MIHGTAGGRNVAVLVQSSSVLSNVLCLLVLQAYVNLKRIYPAYNNSVLRLTSTDMVITLEITEINTKIVYRGSSFSIDLPYSLFGGITEGQCGELLEHFTYPKA